MLRTLTGSRRLKTENLQGRVVKNVSSVRDLETDSLYPEERDLQKKGKGDQT